MSDYEEGGSDQAEKEAEARRALHNLPADELLRRAHFGLLTSLLAKVDLGTISHQEMAILRNMLRDNGMVLGIPPSDLTPGPGGEPAKTRDLPTYEDQDDYEFK